MEVLYIAALYNFNISTVLIDDFIIEDTDLRICLNKKKIIDKINIPEIIQAMELLEYNVIISDKPVVYCYRDIENIADIKIGVKKFLKDISLLFSVIWISHDNAINSEFAFGITSYQGNPAIHSNFNVIRYCMANGKEEVLSLRKSELTASINPLFSLLFAKEEEYTTSNIVLLGHINRLERYQYYIQIARHDKEIALKINSYCIAFEALLSTSTNELAHQLSERIALLVTESIEGRKEVYKLIKKAYGIRSCVAHGGKINTTQEKINEICIEIDKIARWLYHETLLNSEFFNIFAQPDNENINDYFLSLLFK